MPVIEVAPLLDPSKSSPPPDKSGGPRLVRNAPEDGPPFAGFFPRAAAYILDLAVLWAFAFILNRGLRDPLLRIGAGAQLLSAGICLLYFWLGSSGLSQGRTIGKFAMQLRVVGANGLPLNALTALNRALTQNAPLLALLLWSAISLRKPRFSDSGIILDSIAGSFIQGFLLSSALWVSLDPCRRGIHDYFARSWVVKTKTARAVLIAFLTSADREVGKGRILYGIASLLPLIILLGLSGWQVISASSKNTFEKLRETSGELHTAVGSDEFFTYMSTRLLDDKGVMAKSRKQPQGPDPSPLPHKVEIVVDLNQYHRFSDTARSALEALKADSSSLRNFFLDQTTGEMAQQIREESLKEASVTVSAYETLNLGFSFRGSPLARFESSFEKGELPRLGIDPKPTTGTVASSAPASQSLQAGSPAAFPTSSSVNASAPEGPHP